MTHELTKKIEIKNNFVETKKIKKTETELTKNQLLREVLVSLRGACGARGFMEVVN